MSFLADLLLGRPWRGYTQALERGSLGSAPLRFPGPKPLVSVIIPTKNSGRTMELCLAALDRQTYPRIEVLVNDDHSSDDTRALVRKHKRRLLTLNRAMAQGRNSAVPHAKGRYLFHIDSDMELTPRVVEECVWLCETRKLDALIVPEVSVATTYWGRCRALEKLTFLGDPFMEVANRFMRRSAYDTVGGFDEGLMAGEDFDFFERLRAAGLHWGRCASVIRHHELPRLWDTLRKCVRYGQTFKGYIAKHPARSGLQFSPLRPAYLRRIHFLLLDPLHLAGLVLMKGLMYLFTAYGMFFAPPLLAPAPQARSRGRGRAR
jgi:glycosyltransferase involved in cell wall biosynthesis